jgi:hypothetical protein
MPIALTVSDGGAASRGAPPITPSRSGWRRWSRQQLRTTLVGSIPAVARRGTTERGGGAAVAARLGDNGSGDAADTHCGFGGGATVDRVDDEDDATGGEALARRTCTCAMETSQHVVDVGG